MTSLLTALILTRSSAGYLGLAFIGARDGHPIFTEDDCDASGAALSKLFSSYRAGRGNNGLPFATGKIECRVAARHGLIYEDADIFLRRALFME